MLDGQNIRIIRNDIFINQTEFQFKKYILIKM